MRKVYLSARWQETKMRNAYLVSVNKADGRSMRESACVESRMTMESVPSAGRRYLSQQEAHRRYERMEEMRQPMYGRNVFEQGRDRRPDKGKAKNRYSREEAGTIKNAIVVHRFEGSRLTCVCKSKVNW